MKKFIQTKNQELLEKHPTLWNTKIVWMLAVSLILHILFFLAGFMALMDPESLQDYKAIDSFLKNGVIFISIMISILLLVLWLISLLRNNAFKNFYPNSRWKLFKQFAAYFIIFLATTTFYYSYTVGLQIYITNTYGNERMKEDVALANKTAPFFSHRLSEYELDQLRNPSPFDELYCATSINEIDYEQPYFNFKGVHYQFYNLKKEEYSQKEYIHADSVSGNIYNEDKNGKRIFYFVDQVVDVSNTVKTSSPSYLNYHQIFYDSNSDLPDYSRYDYEIENVGSFNPFFRVSEEQKAFLKNHQKFVLEEDQQAYQKLFSDFLELATIYQIKTNLNTSTWMDVAYTKSPYEVKVLIHDNNRPYESSISYQQESEFEIYTKSLKSQKLYLDAGSLNQAFKNIDDIKTTNIFEATIHFFLWAAFFFACIVFIFRTTSLKSLLFSIVASILLMIFVGLMIVLFNFLGFYGRVEDYFALYFIFLLATSILMVSLLGLTKIRKLIGSIFMNITLVGFVPYLLLILLIIHKHQEDWCNYNSLNYISNDGIDQCPTIYDYLEVYWSYVFLAAGVTFVFFFCHQILKWRAKPEG